MAHASQFRWFLLSSGLMVFLGCSCSRIPESPPGPGVVSETRHINTGTVIQVPPRNTAAPGLPTAIPAGNTPVNPGRPVPASGSGNDTGIVDKPTGPMLTPRN